MALRRAVLAAVIGVSMIFATATAAGADQHGDNHHGDHDGHTTVCAGGPFAPGTYGSVVVTGFCMTTPGVFTIKGSLTIAPNGGLDATNCDSHVTVRDGILVLPGGVLGLGGSVNGTGCAADTNDVVRGGLHAFLPIGVIVHGTQINDGFAVLGGGGWTDCTKNVPGLPFPPYTDIEDSQINGGASIAGMSTCWMGFIRNQVHGDVRIDNNTMGDPDAIEIGLNTIQGDLHCRGNQIDPAVGGPGGVPTNSFDGSPANPNTVSGEETGQCKGL